MIQEVVILLFNEFFRLDYEKKVKKILEDLKENMKIREKISFFFPIDLSRSKRFNLYDYIFIRVLNKHHPDIVRYLAEIVHYEKEKLDWKKIFNNHKNKDLLGFYRINLKWEYLKTNFFIKEEIEEKIIKEPYEIILYLKTIVKCANDLHINPEDLIYVVLTHEIAHLLTHQGRFADSEQEIWNTIYFENAGSDLKESLAQYYTLKSLEFMSKDPREKNLKFKSSFYHLNAFMALYNVQSETYRKFTYIFGEEPTSKVSNALKEVRMHKVFDDESKSEIYFKEYLKVLVNGEGEEVKL